ncbi:MAG TPA: phenylalanine--tRNA ligase subunit beta [Actinomycetota bacterium]|nr:phenylalanine--tRNA ligase subunit beta [Actinomycetota bacterium]
MRVSLAWLREFVDVDVPIGALQDMLDLSGTKVEKIHRPGEGIEDVVVAQVQEIDPHPNADNLTMVTVSTGDGSQRVVCGARNFAVGDKVALARVGARLPGMEITERKIRGEVSAGMLCSASELGVSKDHSGLLILPEDAGLGDDVVRTLGLDDSVFELEITPNRPDCMSVVGVAREVAALTGNELRLPPGDVTVEDDLAAPVSVRIEDPAGCPRFVARYLTGVKVGPSPQWMAARLVAAGVRPVSNVVDVTNYVLMELGQPLHAYDAAKVPGMEITVRRARAGEALTTLDGVERSLHPDDLVIAGRDEVLGIAGVMGGAGSEVSDETTEVILECAYFDHAAVAYTSRRHGLRTEASARFERGADPEGPPLAAARAARLMSELAGARVGARVVDEYPAPVERPAITLRPQRTSRVLGTDVPTDRQARHLRSIGIDAVESEDGTLLARVPSFRPDLTREIDLVEEVVRLYGIDRVTSTLPPGRAGRLDEVQRFDRALRRTLAGLGLREAWTDSFLAMHELDDLGLASDHPARRLVRVANPVVEERPALRTTLLPGLLRAAARNAAHRVEGVALFEIARVYEPSDDELPLEARVLAGVLSGRRRAAGWTAGAGAWDFFSAKGVLEAAFRSLRLPAPELSPGEAMPFHPTRAASMWIGGTVAGAFGEVHPDVCDRFDVPEGTVAFELSLAPVVAALPERVKAGELPKFPPLLIDLAVVVDEGVPARTVTEIVRAEGAPEVASARLFDLYRGDQIAEGKKSLAFALEIRAGDRTLTDEEALAVRDRIVAALGERVGAELRA